MKSRVPLKFNKLIKQPSSLKLLAFVLTIGIWEFTASKGIYRTHLFPPPSKIIPSMIDMIQSGELWSNLKSSSQRWFFGYGIGTILGITMGTLTGRSYWLKHTLGSIFNALSSIPKIVLIPLAILWFGLGETQKILLVAWGSFFPIWLNTQMGIEQIEKEYLWTANSLGIKNASLFFHVIIPSALPNIITGMRIAISTATFSLAAAEMSGAFSGIIHQIFYSHEMFQTERMMAGMIYVTIFSFLLNEMFIFLAKVIVPWATTNREQFNEE